MPADHPALIANGLDARVHLHGLFDPVLVVLLLVPVNDAAPGQVVGRELHDDAVLGQDADVVLPHLAADVGEHSVPVLQFDPEHRVGQWLHDTTLDLDGPVLLRHAYTASSFDRHACAHAGTGRTV